MKSWPRLLFVSLSLPAIGQSSSGTSQDNQAGHVQSYTSLEQEPDDLRQELDADAAALSKIPADPLLQTNPLGFLFKPIDHLTDRTGQSERLKLGATYTFLNQYATTTPGSIRHNQPSGRLDFSESGLLTIMKVLRGLSVFWCARAPISASVSSSTLATVWALVSTSTACREVARRSPSHSTSSTGGKIY